MSDQQPSTPSPSAATQAAFALGAKTAVQLWWMLGFMLVVRVFCSIVVPLADTAEARYGEIARKMLETGDWITPQFSYGVPFWAKPPLSTWLSAFSMKLFGVNEFAARLPSLLLGFGMLWLVWQWLAARRGRDFALVAVTILAGLGLFFMAGGAVMTDSSLAFCTTLTMIAFWQALHTSQRYWGYLLFVGLGAGLLAKGPLVGVLTFMPIVPWVIARGNWREVWRRIPWFSGTLLMLAIALPWYLLAERKTPGFLAYFILGEHFGRFLNPGWTGDRYGNAHSEPLGTIWLYWLGAAFPWSLVIVARSKTLLQRRREWLADDEGFVSYLLWWSFVSIVFFTFSRNIIWTYALPALPAFAVLVAELLHRLDTGRGCDRLLRLSVATPLALLLVGIIYAAGDHTLLKPSQRDSAKLYMQLRPSADSGLYYYRRRYYAGEFYSAGKAAVVFTPDFPRLYANGVVDFLVIQSDDLQAQPPALLEHFQPIREFGEFVMLREITAAPAP